jgi:hypothetical protein
MLSFVADPVASVPASVVIATFESPMQTPCWSHAIRTLVSGTFPAAVVFCRV